MEKTMIKGSSGKWRKLALSLPALPFGIKKIRRGDCSGLMVYGEANARPCHFLPGQEHPAPGEIKYQDLAVLDTVEYGRMLVLDGIIMTTEKDEFFYHEMITHVPLHAHPRPEQVLVVGGGDGGTVREVLKHPTVSRVVLAEIDEGVVNAARKYFPALAVGLPTRGWRLRSPTPSSMSGNTGTNSMW